MAKTRRLAAIMFTDMVGYTAGTQADESATLALRKEQENLIRPVLAAHQGRKVKSTGDGFLVEFESALKATECALSIQRRIHERNARVGVKPIQLRIGIHLGDVEQEGTDIFGDAVNIAARIEPVAEPGGICLTGAVYEQVRNKIPDKLEKLPPKELKGVEVPMDIYRVVLPWTAPESAPPRPGPARLAVLPLKNISPDPMDEYFADGLTEELIGTLSKIRELRVIARTSVGQYRATSKTVAQIGSELGVTTVLEGSVRKAGNRLRITLQLIDARTQEHIWANNYDRDLDDVFAIQTEIAENTASALRLELLRPERESIEKVPTTDLAAYHLYLKGIHASSAEDSVRFFEEAIRNDPHFSEAHSHLANVLIDRTLTTFAGPQANQRVRELVAKAIELDPSSADAHTARGNMTFQWDHDWEVAETELRRAISLNPSHANAHHWYGHLLKALNRYDEAVKEFTIYKELNPDWLHPGCWLLTCQILAGDPAPVIARVEQARDKSPADPELRVMLGILYLQEGRINDARREAERAQGRMDGWSEWNRAVLWAQVGRTDDARRVLREMEEASPRYVAPEGVASIYAALGEKAKALEWLEREHGEGASYLVLDYQSRIFDSIRDDPGFRSVLERLKLPTEVKWTRGARTSP
ncbi:MAG: tetratricopeptide repeat protein [Thermoplasmata archaeon]